MALSIEQLNKFVIDFNESLVFATMRRYHVSFHDAQELVQEGFVISEQKRESFISDSHDKVAPALFLAWMKKTIFHQLANQRRKKQPMFLQIDEIFAFEGPESRLEGTERWIRIQSVLDLMTENHCKILTMRYLDGFENHEIALAHKISPDAVRSRLKRARESFLEIAKRLNLSFP